MAMYDSPGLLALFNLKARRPTVDEFTDPQKYLYLAIGQEQWMYRLAAMVPQVNYGGLVKLTTADSGLTYTFGVDSEGNNITPYGSVELRASKTTRPLRPGPDFDLTADFVHEGPVIRFPGGRTKTFSDGPYARFCKRPAPITAAQAPTLLPVEARGLIVARALIEWATEDGTRDPSHFQKWEQAIWSGDPNLPGDVGILGVLKNQYAFGGMEALGNLNRQWWTGIDSGVGYSPIK